MKRYSFFQLLIVCTGIIFLFGSFTTVFEETPFMKGILDNPENTSPGTFTSPAGVAAPILLSNILADNQFTQWKSMLLLSMKNVEKARITREKLIHEKQATLMAILKTCNQELSKFNEIVNPANLSKKIEDANRKLEEGINILNQLEELHTEFQ